MSLKVDLLNFWGDTPEDEFYASQGMRNKNDFFKTPHGTIFTQEFLPIELQPKGILCMTHGYGSDTSWTFQILALEAVKWGHAVYCADMLGHGRSDGILGYITDVEKMAAASLTFFKEMRDSDVNKGLPTFLFGESMGGGVTFLMHFQDPKGWDGFIFASPLFKMPDLMRPTRLEIIGFSLLRRFVDTWALFPDRFKGKRVVGDPIKGATIFRNPRRYTGKPRVGTMLELSRMVDDICMRMDKFNAPFLTLRGTADEITAPEGNQALFEMAATPDRTLKP
ncbi:caffeoylshikimate esterase isoform X1 [Physcomitrium patens]|uniref:Serine aminopeptidase S33 domain-containing protein n=1 Tax=Physcomitrium patens TaxID=3218 RepID=A0A2K1IYG0_PHYPA|nr:caffeoylshikimate esterase-like isoform X1 [Physcomitrium patens]PNR34304.1 hypothetical protein PHYPA_024121 [Physcomitrium patens]|eukprot:XP_024356527.1 caffeoylshikimate esterase-like isoform X1 [Physcomitrella patens]